METIFKRGVNKVIRIFYENKRDSIHLREISRRAGINENSASRILNHLEEQKILISKKEGNLKKYKINKNKIVFSIFCVIDVHRFEKLPETRKRAIKIFLKKLKEKPLIVVLFGSTAQGNYTKDSDLDLVLIVNRKINTNESEEYSETQTGIRINSFQIKFSELDKIKDKVILSAINTGYPLTNHIKFYEEVL